MHEGWKSSMVAVEGSHFVVQSMCSSMMMMMMMMKHLESILKVQSSWRRLGDKKRCRKEEFHGNDSRNVFPLDIDGYFYDAFSYDSTHSSPSFPIYPIIHTMSQMSSLIVIHFYSYDSFSCVASSFFHGCTIVLTEAAHHDSFLTHFWLTLFSMLVEYSRNDVVIALSA